MGCVSDKCLVKVAKSLLFFRVLFLEFNKIELEWYKSTAIAKFRSMKPLVSSQSIHTTTTTTTN
jgi:hypothetical protein